MPTGNIEYDETLTAFGHESVRSGEYRSVTAFDHSGYSRFGMRGDSLAARLANGSARGTLPLTRAKLASRFPDGSKSMALLLEWTAKLARTGLLDILSIRGSWGRPGNEESASSFSPRGVVGDLACGSPDARRFRSGGPRTLGNVVRILEDGIDIAWYDLRLWRYPSRNGEDPDSVRDYLRRLYLALASIAGTEKPVEYDLAYRLAPIDYGDDLTYLLSGFLAAKAAKVAGIRKFILQASLGTPINGSGIRDLSKTKALLHSVRELEDGDFKVYLEAGACPGGLFSRSRRGQGAARGGGRDDGRYRADRPFQSADNSSLDL